MSEKDTKAEVNLTQKPEEAVHFAQERAHLSEVRLLSYVLGVRRKLPPAGFPSLFYYPHNRHL